MARVSSRLHAGLNPVEYLWCAPEAARAAQLLPGDLPPVKRSRPPGLAADASSAYLSLCLLGAGKAISFVSILCDAQYAVGAVNNQHPYREGRVQQHKTPTAPHLDAEVSGLPDYPRRIADRRDTGRNGFDDDRSCADCAAVADVVHQNGAIANPAVGPNSDCTMCSRSELPTLFSRVLMPAAGN